MAPEIQHIELIRSSYIFLIEEYALKLMQWTTEFKAHIDGIGERLDTIHTV